MIKQWLINKNKTPIGLRLDNVVVGGSLHSFLKTNSSYKRVNQRLFSQFTRGNSEPQYDISESQYDFILWLSHSKMLTKSQYSLVSIRPF